VALQTSGAISLNDIHVEVGGSSGSSVGINDTDVRDLTGVGSGGTSSFNSFYGKSAINTAGPTTISYSFWGFADLGGVCWGGYYNDYYDNFRLSDDQNAGMSVANAQTYYPYGKLGSAATNPLVTPSGHLVREIGKSQHFNAKGTTTIRFNFIISGHHSDSDSVFTSVRVNKGQGSDTTFTRASRTASAQTHAYTKNANISFFHMQDDATSRNTSDPITQWNWTTSSHDNEPTTTAGWKALLGWGDGSNGFVSNMEIL